MSKLKLLLPLDGTGFSRQILPTVQKLFDPPKYRVTLLHVASAPGSFEGAYLQPATYMDAAFYIHPYTPDATPHPVNSEEVQTYKKELEANLKADFAALAEAYELDILVVFGNPLEEIKRVAEETKPDVIAMASHERSALNRFFVGSVTRQIEDAVNAPILSLRLEQPPETE